MKILLVYPPREGEVCEFITADFVNDDAYNYPPMGLLAIAANVDPRHSLKVLDCCTQKLSIDDTINFIVDEDNNRITNSHGEPFVNIAINDRIMQFDSSDIMKSGLTKSKNVKHRIDRRTGEYNVLFERINDQVKLYYGNCLKVSGEKKF